MPAAANSAGTLLSQIHTFGRTAPLDLKERRFVAGVLEPALQVYRDSQSIVFDAGFLVQSGAGQAKLSMRSFSRRTNSLSWMVADITHRTKIATINDEITSDRIFVCGRWWELQLDRRGIYVIPYIFGGDTKENTFSIRDDEVGRGQPDIVSDVHDRLAQHFEECAASDAEQEKVIREIVFRCGMTRILAQERSIISFPAQPPNGETYDRRLEGEDAPAFIQRVYNRWLTGEFTRADLRRLDAKAEMALRNWERKNGRAKLELPTLKERNDRQVAEGSPLTAAQYREAHRLRVAQTRRKSRNPKM